MLKFLERLPIVIVFGVLCLGLFLGIGTMTRPMFRLKLASLDAPRLAGMQIHWAAPKFSLKSVMDGSFQKSTELLLEDVFPFRAAIVRAVNQAYYSLFARSYMYRNEIVIGRHQYLFETIYLERYCNTPPHGTSTDEVNRWAQNNPEGFERWAKNIENIGDFFASRGQTFLFLLTPSKAAHYPEYMPRWFGCNMKPPRRDYQLAATALTHTHVPYVDLSKLIHESKGKYPAPMFNRGGTHWTSLAVAMSAREVVAKIAAQGKWPLPEVRYSATPSYETSEVDRDLLEVLNLWSPGRRYLTANTAIERVPVVSDSTPAPRIAIVGGSFMGQMYEALYDTGMFPSVDYYFYLMMEHRRHPSLPYPPLTPYDANYYRGLFEADIVILEENEANLISPHVQMLEEALALYAGRPLRDNESLVHFSKGGLRLCTSGTRQGC